VGCEELPDPEFAWSVGLVTNAKKATLFYLRPTRRDESLDPNRVKLSDLLS
jgi:hypothetical protein